MATLLLAPGAWLIVTGTGIWSMRMWAIVSTHLAGYVALGCGLTALLLHVLGSHAPSGLIGLYFVHSGLWMLLLPGLFDLLVRLLLCAAGLGLICFARDGDVLVWFQPNTIDEAAAPVGLG